MEDAFDGRSRYASHTSWWIRSLRIDRWQISLLRKRHERSGIMAYSDEGRRRGGDYRLLGSRPLGLLGSGRERYLLPRYERETRDRLLRCHYPPHHTSVRSGESSSHPSAGASRVFGQGDNPIHPT